MSTAPLSIGDQFVATDSRKYTDRDGTSGIHQTSVLMEVTAITDQSFDYRSVEVLHEAGRPSFSEGPSHGGTMAWFGLDNAIAKGRVRRA